MLKYSIRRLNSALKENPYDPKKKKCIGNAWFIPYTPTSRLSKQFGVNSSSWSNSTRYLPLHKLDASFLTSPILPLFSILL